MGNKSSSQTTGRTRGSADPQGVHRNPLLAAPLFHQSATSLHYPSGTDSGYMTSPAETERIKAWRGGHSQLSLNESFPFEVPPLPPQIPPVPVFSIPPPNYKQFKKWQKKQRKIMKKLGPLPVSVLPMGPQITPLPHIAVPPYSRAISVDNLNCQLLNEYAEVQNRNRGFWSSKMDISRHHFDGEIPKSSPCPKSTISSGCSNFHSQRNSMICSNSMCDQNRMCATEHPSLRAQRSSPTYTKHKTDGSHVDAKQNDRYFRNSFPNTPSGDERQYVQSNGSGSGKVDKNTDSVNGRNRFETITEELKVSSEMEDSPYPRTNSSSNDSERKETDDRGAISRYKGEIVGIEVINKGHSSIVSDDKGKTVLKMNDSYESSSSERSIPMRMTDEAKQILEKSECVFNKPSTKIAGENFQEFDISSDNNSKNYAHVPCQISDRSQEANSLKRNVDHGSTLSSLTLSSNIKTEISEIDFSWVDDVENRLEKEIAFVKEDYSRHQMPVRYFGIDELVDNKFSDGEGVKGVDKRNHFSKTMEVFGEPDARRELSKIHSDVRNKAAMFDSEALRTDSNSSQFFEKRPPVMGKYRARSTPRNANSMYIPLPDYRNSDFNNTNHYFGAKSYQDLSMKRNGIIQKPEKMNEIVHPHRIAVSPSDPYESQLMRHRAYENELLQRNRTYDATEYYRQNAARRNAEKSWRTSVAY